MGSSKTFDCSGLDYDLVRNQSWFTYRKTLHNCFVNFLAKQQILPLLQNRTIKNPNETQRETKRF